MLPGNSLMVGFSRSTVGITVENTGCSGLHWNWGNTLGCARRKLSSPSHVKGKGAQAFTGNEVVKFQK